MLTITIDDQEIETEIFYFPAGEPNLRINGYKGTRATVTSKPFELNDLILILLARDLLRNSYEIKNISLKIPYLPFGRQDRRILNNECFGLQVLGNILHGQFENITTYDAHNPTRSKEHISWLCDASPYILLSKIIKEHDIKCLIYPDKGAFERYGELFPTLGGIICNKKRDLYTGHIIEYEVDQTKVIDVLNCLVIDDICDGGMTFIKLGEALKDRCKSLSLYVSHGIFSKGLNVLKPYYDHVYTTDSICKEKANEYLTIYRCL